MGYPIQLVRWGTSGLAVLTFRDPENSMPGMLYLIQDTTFVSNVQADVSELSKSHELVQQRWTRLSKADIAKIVHP
jgi:hypothetical protein